MAGPDFSSLMKKPAGQGKKMEPLPADTYPGIIASYEFGDQNKNKTPYLRIHGRYTGPGNVGGTPEALASLEIDVTKRKFRRDIYLRGSDPNDKEGEAAALFRLDELLRSLGIEPNGGTYEELIPQIVAKNVMVETTQYLGQNNDIGNQVNNIVGA